MELDYRKVLGVCFKFVRDEVSKTTSEIEVVKSALSNLEQLVSSHNHDFQLPDGIVFESHLTHELSQLSLYIKKATDALDTKISTLTTSHSSLISDIKDKLEADLLSLKACSDEHRESAISKISEVLNDLTSYKSEISVLFDDTKSNINELADRIDHNHTYIQTLLKESVDLLTSEFDNKLSYLDSNVQTKLESIIESASSTKLEFDKVVDELNLKINSLHNDFKSEISKLSKTITKVATSKADIEHSHDQYASLSELNDISEIINSILTNLDSLSEDSLRQSDKDSLIEEISKVVKKSIHVPKDGRDGENGKDGKPGLDGKDGKDGQDASEWDITWHPTIRGRLGIKNSKWKDYKWQDLLIRSSQPSLPSGGFIGGGGGSSSSGVISVNGKTGIVNLTAEDILVDSTPQAGEISYVDGQVHTITVGEKVTTILRSGSTIVGVNKGTYTKNFIRNESGSIIGWTIS